MTGFALLADFRNRLRRFRRRALLLALLPAGFAACEALAPITDMGAQMAAQAGILSHETAAGIHEAAQKAGRELTPKEEYFVGRAVAAQILSRYPRLKNAAAERYVTRVGLAVAYASDRPEVYGGYHFVILDTGELNAFAAPGGFVFVTRGTLSLCDNEEELAGILAHEVGHVVRRHGLDAIRTAQWAKIGSLVAQDLASRQEELKEAVRFFDGAIDSLADTLVNKGRSRTQEYEADGLGLSCAARAGYDPAGISSFLKRLGTQGGGAAAGGFFRTHPAPTDRLGRLPQAPASPGSAAGRGLRDARFSAASARWRK